MAPSKDQPDIIDHFISEWAGERPHFDASELAVLGRIARISTRMRKLVDGWLAEQGLSWETFDLIVTLRRSGPPYALKPTVLYKATLLSSGAITNRIDRVQALGLVSRTDDPQDGRGVLVKLTPKGQRLAEAAADIHFNACRAILDEAFTEEERGRLAELLRKLVLVLEESGTASRLSAVSARHRLDRG